VQVWLGDASDTARMCQRGNMATLLEQLHTLGDSEWIFRTAVGTPLDPKNAMNRHLWPVANSLGITLGGRHSTTHLLRKYPVKVVSEILGHGDIETTLSVYQHPAIEDRRGPLNDMAVQMLPDVTKACR
jgi:integrase